MRLLHARVVGVGPFADLTFRFANDDGVARSAIVILGGGGTGKTSLLSAIAQTRPGLSIALPKPRVPRRAETPFAVTEWALGQDDVTRPHPLVVLSPNAVSIDDDELALLRRREQAAFDRRAAESGFAFLTFSGARWFSRTPIMLTTPDRTLLRFDVRAPASFDDATRADLSRETKQALSYGDIAARLEEGRGGPALFALVGRHARRRLAAHRALRISLLGCRSRFAGAHVRVGGGRARALRRPAGVGPPPRRAGRAHGASSLRRTSPSSIRARRKGWC